ncbi:hypothetical protein SPRG_11214 [Saprolegnia parasitica CBS 223.65]|uniref:START domain-containing protein n=1 Tax=Saprolegnia parasitica (strain CBS 223.65) TaxID=695850 RepID=A0A067BZU6_SAPPC|nr:hypothetical protein SPRG_11214 [Saprolegnia parasitica CBS 223.65]KDO23783.1 hypothetical protein SPRG_11214 [Saprolegnia parasitica CBS 223.65]|eukprot:XP_012205422.1 hypothetical protein SPRG_11214 [Saprolegnia parasitica CBS 223.65]
MADLKRTVGDLSERVSTLRTLQCIERDFATPASWEAAALEQSAQHRQALRDNESLRAVLYEHLALADELQRLITKRPRLASASSSSSVERDAWRLEPSETAAELHALVDNEYDRLEAVLVKNGLESNSTACAPALRCCCDPLSNAKAIEMVRSYAVAVPWTTLADAVWRIWSSGVDYSQQPGALYQCGELLDANAAYVAFSANLSPDPTAPISVQGNLVVKRYLEADRIVFVWRSVARDAGGAATGGAIADNECGWLLVEPCDTNEARVKLVLTSKLSVEHDAIPDSVDETLADAMTLQCHLKSTTKREVKFMRLWAQYFERTWDAMVALAVARAHA